MTTGQHNDVNDRNVPGDESRTLAPALADEAGASAPGIPAEVAAILNALDPFWTRSITPPEAQDTGAQHDAAS